MTTPNPIHNVPYGVCRPSGTVHPLLDDMDVFTAEGPTKVFDHSPKIEPSAETERRSSASAPVAQADLIAEAPPDPQGNKIGDGEAVVVSSGETGGAGGDMVAVSQSIHSNRSQPTFGRQLWATILRILRLRQREIISTCVELLIPIVFIVGSVLIWLVFGRGKNDELTFVSRTMADNMAATLQGFSSYVCYNGSQAIGSLLSCSALPGDAIATLICAQDGIGVPSGLCFLPEAAYFASSLIQSSLVSGPGTIPTLDQMIPIQWVNQIMYRIYGYSVNPNTAMCSLTCSGTLYFTPSSVETQDLVDYFNRSSVFFPYIYGGTIATPAEAERLVEGRSMDDPPIWGVIQVNSLTVAEFDVAIRLNASALPSTKNAVNQYYLGGIERDANEMYVLSGFSTLQAAIYEYYFSDVLSLPVPSRTLLTPMATASYDTQKFLAYGGQLAPLIVVLGFLYPVSQLTKRLVIEKELRLREAMLIMGLSEVAMYLAWFIVYLVQNTVVSLAIAVILRVTYLPRANFGIIFFLFFFFTLSIMMLSGLLSTLFSKSRLAALLAPLIYFVLAIPLFALQNASAGAMYGVSLLSPSALAVGVSIIFRHELTGGISGADLTYFRDNPKMLFVLVILLIDSAIYLVLMLYLDAVIPKDWGTPRHPLFCIIEPFRYFCCKRKREHSVNYADGRAPNGVYEEIPEGERSVVRIVGLCKKYRRGKVKFLAVNNLHLTLREGEVSVLLGHNGAGKTTTMNMMTGMIKADYGDCFIYGHSVRHDLSGARQEIGFCPQHNILWPQLTCREHLEYYASIKGLSGKARDAAVDNMLRAVDLSDKVSYKSKRLSGGQKRKLSVAIAFVGGSRLVFLDEPTAGMDVGARRHSWGLIKEMSASHTILLTTHYMDEADLLGNSISIMNRGRLQCSGSSVFLKSRLGVGYNIIMSVLPHVDRQRIDQLILNHVSDAEPVGSGAGEMAFRLPIHAKAHFPELLNAIESDGEAIGVKGYSLSATTLEEIFIRIAKSSEEGEEETPRSGATSSSARAREVLTPAPEPEQSVLRDGDSSTDHSRKTPKKERAESSVEMVNLAESQFETREEEAAKAASTVWSVSVIDGEAAWMWSQLRSMMAKRLWNSLRDRRTQFFQIVCPVACVLLAMLLTLIKLFDSPTLELTSDIYETKVTINLVNCESVFDQAIRFSSLAVSEVPVGPTEATTLEGYFLDTYSTHSRERYGSFACNDPTLSATAVFYNFSAFHEVAVGVANFYRGIAQAANPAVTMRTAVQTMPRTKQEKAYFDSIYSIIISIVILIPFTFIPSTFVGWVVKERQCKARHLQNVSGLSFTVYWVSNFLFDICSYIITMFLVIIVFAIFRREEYVAPEKIGATILLFFLYGVSGVAMAYAVSFLFSEHSTAQNVVMLANFIAGFLLALAVAMLQIIESTKSVANILRWIFRIVPSYCVGEGILNLSVLQAQQAFGGQATAWDMDVVGWPCVFMAAELPIFFCVTLIIDHPARRQRSQRLFHNPDAEPEHLDDEDDDVTAERSSVLLDPERSGDLVRVVNLRKQYPNGTVAVRNVTFGVKPGEVFGFLGTNGAGKTTTISILCQEFYPTSGHASICGHDIVDSSREALRCIGYCPQFDACIDLLTVEEHLYMYAGIRGIQYDQRDTVVGSLMSLCELTEYRKTLSHELSGGNRRKLSVAVSLIGGPRVVFLDEPSAGMDPVARRGLWTAIQTVADTCAVVLTTHHLEEVEALAHRVAIMVDGSLRCIGDKTHLQTKYGSGFEVHVRVAEADEATKTDIEQFFTTNFPESVQNEYRSQRFVYALPQHTKLSTAFSLLEQHKEQLHITDYTVAQTSIEQIFLRISEAAEAAHGTHPSDDTRNRCHGVCCCSCC